MKVFKIKLYQELVNYRKPFSYNFLETYPLPSFSMIRGWIYNSIDAKDKENYYKQTISNLKIGISGKLSGLTYDLQHFIKLDTMSDFKKIIKDFANRTPTYVALISSVDLNIYISAEKKLLNDFEKNIFRNYPSLGRYENLANIISYNTIELEERTFSARKESHVLKYYTYLSEKKVSECEGLKGSYLQIPTIYRIENGIRYFNKANVLCLSDNCIITEGTFYYDDTDKDDQRIVDLIPLVN